jgi:hypothetical protein
MSVCVVKQLSIAAYSEFFDSKMLWDDRFDAWRGSQAATR